jgi:hypothetical protein
MASLLELERAKSSFSRRALANILDGGPENSALRVWRPLPSSSQDVSEQRLHRKRSISSCAGIRCCYEITMIFLCLTSGSCMVDQLEEHM